MRLKKNELPHGTQNPTMSTAIEAQADELARLVETAVIEDMVAIKLQDFQTEEDFATLMERFVINPDTPARVLWQKFIDVDGKHCPTKEYRDLGMALTYKDLYQAVIPKDMGVTFDYINHFMDGAYWTFILLPVVQGGGVRVVIVNRVPFLKS